MALKSTKINTIFFDMDGTLLDLSFDNHFWKVHIVHAYAEKNALSLTDAQHILIAKFQQFHGTLSWYCVDFWRDTLQLDIMALKAEVKNTISYRPHAQNTLKTLRQQGYRLVLATNAHRTVLDLKCEQLPDLSHYFHAMYSSHDFNYPKESPLFWQALHQQEHFMPEQSLFIDDSLSVLNAAHAFGLTTIAISQPDMTEAPVMIAGHLNIRHLNELLPLL